MASRQLLGKSIAYWGALALVVLALAAAAFWSGRASASDEPHPTISAGIDRQATVVALNGDQAFGLAGYGEYKTYRVQDQEHTCYMVVSLFDRAASISCPK